MNRSMHPPTSTFKAYREALMGVSQVHCPGGLTTHCPQGYVLKLPSLWEEEAEHTFQGLDLLVLQAMPQICKFQPKTLPK